MMQEDYSTQERNKQIVRMLGWKLVKGPYYYYWKKSDGILIPTWKELKFHSDWNLLMEAVLFINNVSFSILEEFIYMFKNLSFYYTEQKENKIEPLEHIFKMVSDFALKYNKK